jgi:hypothetical protein
MRSRYHLVFVVFCLTAVLIFAVYLRSANNRIFFDLCTCRAEQSRLKLLLEGLINPAALSRRFDELNTND